ncbi:putative aminoadipate-semialdehyde dehydrogenase [Aspergillus steynii IBT 23096]|uniref:Putative aminoadipate-semialdehyde dehydrogenase n=1 Tax=Aspergillus steynii IBT 23096 TaxID=1392250 RepID=A0A2I2G892_9EURO|nr:putative aminoadipate-semialdehyde dehydrogenase [Aspergillus steynii IBT 23096]PLB49063.1 putative aminoadipate-semialdehyde dehydrogenase [Aspergillus steynii IBT 23096]
MSKAEVDGDTITEIARACNVSETQIEDIYSPSPLQSRLIVRAEVFQLALSFGPDADIDRFCKALTQVAAANPILRTRFVDSCLGIVQVITDEEHTTQTLSGTLDDYLNDEDSYKLGLGVPLFRSSLIDRKFVATIHHAVMDYWSVTTFFQEDVVGAYHGQAPKERPPFKDFVAHISSIDESAAQTFWGPRFKGVPALFPTVSPGYAPHAKQIGTRKIALKGIGEGVSPSHLSSFVAAAWALTTGVYTGSENVAFGLVLSGRSSTLNGLENALGPTLAEVPVQVNLPRNLTVEKLIKDRATTLRQLQTHHTLQYGIKSIGSLSDAAHIASGFHALLNIRPPLPIATEATDVQFERLLWPQGSFSLELVCSLYDDGILVEPRNDPDVLDERQLDRVLNQFEHTLQLLTEVPLHTKLGQLQLLNSHDRAEILEWNTNIPEPIEKCVHDVFSAQARAHPEDVAVEASDGSLCYGELDELSDRLAFDLQRRGVSTGKSVALIFEKSLWAIVAVLSVLKTGGVCVPIDKYALYDHRASIVSTTNANIVLTSSAEYANSANLAPDVIVVSQESIAALPDTETLFKSMVSPEDLAYITFTSGSSVSAPKAVMLEHRNLVSSLTSLVERFDLQPECQVLQYAAPVSNTSIGEMLAALFSGGCLCIPSEAASASNLSGFIQSSKVNWAFLPPGVIRTLSPNHISSLQSLVSLGEPIAIEAAKTWGDAVRFFNSWGLCEASFLSTVAEITPNSEYPESIGTPVGCAIWIVKPGNTNELTPIGDVGELWIESPSVARGFINDEPKTSASFISPPLWASSFPRNATRFCRTGDLAKYNPDGSISFVGRQDNQVKLGGQKVQLEEIESILSTCPLVRELVTSAKISAGRTQLVAVVCLADVRFPRSAVLQDLPDSEKDLANEQLDRIRDHARSRLPAERAPTIWLTVEQLPRTVSGKLDRGAIREWLKIKGGMWIVSNVLESASYMRLPSTSAVGGRLGADFVPHITMETR